MIQRSFESITKADIDSLITVGVMESKTLEYKQELPGCKNEDKKEFLADVTSFANASGGDIIYGIQEAKDASGKKTGAPAAAVPIAATTADEVIRRLDQMILNGVDPRLRVQIKPISGWRDDGKGFVILVRVPKSISSPHMVTLGGSSRFYSRSSAGRYQLDVDELRASFLAQESHAQRIRAFLQDRIARIHADETPVPMKNPQRIILHLIPTTFFLSGRRLQLPSEREMTNVFTPRHFSYTRYALEGFLTVSSAQDNARAYCLLMFNGCVELVCSNATWVCGDQTWVEDLVQKEGYADRVYDYIQGLKSMDVTPPFVVHATAVGCEGAIVSFGDWGGPVHSLQKTVIQLPEAVFVEYPETVNAFYAGLRPLADGLANASGLRSHPAYNEQGQWEPFP